MRVRVSEANGLFKWRSISRLNEEKCVMRGVHCCLGFRPEIHGISCIIYPVRIKLPPPPIAVIIHNFQTSGIPLYAALKSIFFDRPKAFTREALPLTLPTPLAIKARDGNCEKWSKLTYVLRDG